MWGVKLKFMLLAYMLMFIEIGWEEWDCDWGWGGEWNGVVGLGLEVPKMSKEWLAEVFVYDMLWG